jgi:hypothetical protein
LLDLLGFELELQNPMIEKIQRFMAKIVHKTILNMRNFRLNKQLEDMWCSSSTRLSDRPTLNEVLGANMIT